MQEDRQSQLKLYSIGIVIEDKKANSDLIKVTPTEDLSFLNGKLADHKTNYDTKAPDARGIQRVDKVEGGADIVAKWLPFGQSNRITPPDVVASETVILFRFADTDEYYWTTIFREPSLRRREHVMYAFGNLAAGTQPWNKDSSYWTEVSTRDKHIHVHTAKSDGEPFEYDIILDTEKGTFTIADDVGNSIKLDSSISTAEITTNEAIKWKSKTVTIEATDLNITGNTTITGNTSVTGAVHADGDFTGSGAVTVVGAVHGSNI